VLPRYSNIKFHENPSSVSRVVPCGLADGRTGMKKLTVGIRNFANAPKKLFFLLAEIISDVQCVREVAVRL